ncbi:beta-N-acetylglucosaminidase domain-containing protein [Microbacterium sp. YY-01]|uniref:beta-N-acetylglucosaminidase domain-containing protein n=1 Tax=Microbacterium sp. YY-01 TaxID=3421634 RepID=UPI003D185128
MFNDDANFAMLIPRPSDIRWGSGRFFFDDVLVRMNERTNPAVPYEGYVLTVNAETAELQARDARGFLNGYTTLRQVADSNAGFVPEMTITDAPTLARRGIIEGFYGEPWTHDERRAALQLAGRLKLNSYVYAPKDDPYHRDQWREPYPPEALARLVDLAQEGLRHGVDVVVALHPACSMVFSDEHEHELLAAKARQLLDAGIPDVALLFDDVPPRTVHARDKEAFGEGGGPLGTAHAMTVRRFAAALEGRRASDDLFVVAMDYAGTHTNDYRAAFVAGLPDEARVWWTGSDIVVGEITREDIDAAAEVFGDRLLLWDNFPVNDFDRGRAFLGPLIGRTREVHGSALRGAWTNPMVEYSPGGFGIASFADWAWNSRDYVPARSARAARVLIAGAQASELEPLLATLSSWPPSASMETDLATLARRTKDGSVPARERLRARLREWVALENVSVDEEPARSLQPWLHAAVDMAKAGLAALDLDEGTATAVEVAAALERAEAHSAKVGVDVIPEFVRATADSLLGEGVLAGKAGEKGAGTRSR